MTNKQNDAGVTTITAKISVAEKAAAQKYCKEHDETLSHLVRRILREYLKDVASE